jgi:hypothetical protein
MEVEKPIIPPPVEKQPAAVVQPIEVEKPVEKQPAAVVQPIEVEKQVPAKPIEEAKPPEPAPVEPHALKRKAEALEEPIAPMAPPEDLQKVTSDFLKQEQLPEPAWEVNGEGFTTRQCYFVQSPEGSWKGVKIYPKPISKDEVIAALGGPQVVLDLGIRFMETREARMICGFTFRTDPEAILEKESHSLWWTHILSVETADSREALYANLGNALADRNVQYAAAFGECFEKLQSYVKSYVLDPDNWETDPVAQKHSISREELVLDALASSKITIPDIKTARDLETYETLLRNPYHPLRFAKEISAKIDVYAKEGPEGELKKSCQAIMALQQDIEPEVEMDSDRGRQVFHLAVVFSLYRDNPSKIAEALNRSNYYDDLVPKILEKMKASHAFEEIEPSYKALENAPRLSPYEKLRLAIISHYVIPHCVVGPLAELSELTSEMVHELPAGMRIWHEGKTFSVITQDKLGEGGLKIVKLAIDYIQQIGAASFVPHMRAHLAIKPGQWTARMLEHQQEILQKLSELSAEEDSHIMRITQVRYDKKTGTLAFLEEYGTEDLGKISEKEGPPRGLDGLRTRAGLFRDAIAGLTRMHAANIVHLDIKPGNITRKSIRDPITEQVSEEGLVNDFDTAYNQNKKSEAILESLISKNTTPTRAYTSPEIVEKGTTIADLRPTDIWQAGLTLLELIGLGPLDSSIALEHDEKPNFEEALKHGIDDSIRELQNKGAENQIFNDAQIKLLGIIKKMLAIKPEDRLTAAGVGAELEQFLHPKR